MSEAEGTTGAAEGFQTLVHGQSPVTMLTVTPMPGDSTLPLSSMARVRIVADPTAPGCQSYAHVVGVGMSAGCQLVPSNETSTPGTAPPPCSVAWPLIVTRVPLGTEAPDAGDTIVELGAKMSADIEAATSGVPSAPSCNDCGWAPMSASRLTVACCIARSGFAGRRSCTASSPHDHCTVPAPNTSAPLLCRYSVSECVALPGPTLMPKSSTFWGSTTVVEDMRINPDGRAPLSTSSS